MWHYIYSDESNTEILHCIWFRTKWFTWKIIQVYAICQALNLLLSSETHSLLVVLDPCVSLFVITAHNENCHFKRHNSYNMPTQISIRVQRVTEGATCINYQLLDSDFPCLCIVPGVLSMWPPHPTSLPIPRMCSWSWTQAWPYWVVASAGWFGRILASCMPLLLGCTLPSRSASGSSATVAGTARPPTVQQYLAKLSIVVSLSCLSLQAIFGQFWPGCNGISCTGFYSQIISNLGEKGGEDPSLKGWIRF